MTQNRVKTAIEQGKVVVGIMVSELRTTTLGPMLEAAGLHFVILDMEHGSYDHQTMADIIAGCRGLAIAPFVRVPEIRRECFLKPLEAGAIGLLVPRVETREQAELCVVYSKYAPEGDRGLSLCRAHTDYTPVKTGEYTAHANQNVMVMIQIETARALKNVDSILATPGIDVAFVGPVDLSLSLGIEADLGAPVMQEALDKIIEAGRRHGVVVGIYANQPDMIKHFVGRGLRFIAGGSDVDVLINGCANSLESFRKVLGDCVL